MLFGSKLVADLAVLCLLPGQGNQGGLQQAGYQAHMGEMDKNWTARKLLGHLNEGVRAFKTLCSKEKT